MAIILKSQNTLTTMTRFDLALLQYTVQECLEEVTKGTLVEHVSFNMRFPAQIGGLPYSWNTYPSEWIAKYLRQSYILRDPVARVGVSAVAPFFWSDLQYDVVGRKILDESCRHGIGPNGCSIPQLQNGMRSLLSITSTKLADEDWRYYVESIFPELQRFANKLHQKAVEELNLKDFSVSTPDSKKPRYTPYGHSSA